MSAITQAMIDDRRIDRGPREVGLEWIDAQVAGGGAVEALGGLVLGPDATDDEARAAAALLTSWAIEDGLSPQWSDEEARARVRERLSP